MHENVKICDLTSQNFQISIKVVSEFQLRNKIRSELMKLAHDFEIIHSAGAKLESFFEYYSKNSETNSCLYITHYYKGPKKHLLLRVFTKYCELFPSIEIPSLKLKDVLNVIYALEFEYDMNSEFVFYNVTRSVSKALEGNHTKKEAIQKLNTLISHLNSIQTELQQMEQDANKL